MNDIARTDVTDEDFVDALELASDGYYVYRNVSLVSTTLATKEVVILSPTSLDILINVDYPLESGDIVEIFGTAAAGFYTVMVFYHYKVFLVV